MAAATDRNRDVKRKREASLAARTITIPQCADKKRRADLESDVFAWLRHYAGDVFTREFTDQQRSMVQAILSAIENGGDQAIAASRGEGKTTIAERVLGYAILTGRIHFAVLFSATGTDAEHSLSSIKYWFESDARLAEDYPEVCAPILALENVPNRAHYQLVTGKRHDNGKAYKAISSRFKWCGRECILPRVPGSPASGANIATRGLDGAVRGLKIADCRPDLAVIDDPDTAETVNSEEQRDKLEAKIDKAIAGLGGQKRSLGRVMLTTIQRCGTASDRYTDATIKPSWRGKRFRFLVKPPERVDLWEEYVTLRSADWVNGTQSAEEFLTQHFEAMHQGAIVGNAYRMPGGQRSALQFYYDEVARIGPEAVATEYDNDPPEETGPVESGINPHRIQRQLSGYDRKAIPPGCVKLTQGIDVRKVALHWVVRAWTQDGTGYTIDYGVHEVHGTKYGSDEGVDVAIKHAIFARLEETKAAGYERPVDLTLIDAGWRTDAVYAACLEAGSGVYPVMGFGQSSGCVRANFSEIQRQTVDRRPGDGWFFSRKGRVWLVCADTDRWKAWEHDRWLTKPGRPGCLYLFGQPGEEGGRLSDDEKLHHSFARHICNEVEVEELHKGTLRRRWKAKSENTHWLDASYYSDVAANILGIRILTQAAKPTTVLPGAATQQAGGGWFTTQKRR